MAEIAGMACSYESVAEQYAELVATKIPRDGLSLDLRLLGFYGSTHRPTDFRWLRGQPDTYFRLEFSPKTRPAYPLAAKDRCQEEIRRPLPTRTSSAPINFIPLNDAQWTLPGTAYAIAVPPPGETLRYEDRASENATMTLRPGLSLRPLLKAESIWYSTVTNLKGEQ